MRGPTRDAAERAASPFVPARGARSSPASAWHARDRTAQDRGRSRSRLSEARARVAARAAQCDGDAPACPPLGRTAARATEVAPDRSSELGLAPRGTAVAIRGLIGCRGRQALRADGGSDATKRRVLPCASITDVPRRLPTRSSAAAVLSRRARRSSSGPHSAGGGAARLRRTQARGFGSVNGMDPALAVPLASFTPAQMRCFRTNSRPAKTARKMTALKPVCLRWSSFGSAIHWR